MKRYATCRFWSVVDIFSDDFFCVLSNLNLPQAWTKKDSLRTNSGRKTKQRKTENTQKFPQISFLLRKWNQKDFLMKPELCLIVDTQEMRIPRDEAQNWIKFRIPFLLQ